MLFSNLLPSAAVLSIEDGASNAILFQPAATPINPTETDPSATIFDWPNPPPPQPK
jgi:hypothetical protein